MPPASDNYDVSPKATSWAFAAGKGIARQLPEHGEGCAQTNCLLKPGSNV